MIASEWMPIVDVVIEGFYAEADFIKCGIVIFHKVQNVRIYAPRILNAGQGDTGNDKGAYAIMCYGDTGELIDITIDDAVIVTPRSCGIYLRLAENVTINNPKVSGQTDTDMSSLPKGGIVTNGAINVKVNGGLLHNNVFHASFVALTGSSAFDIEMTGTRMTGTGTGVILSPASGAGVPDGVRFFNCDVAVAGHALRQLNENRAVKNLVINGGRWVSTGATAIELNPYDGAALTGYRFENCTIGSPNRGIDADSPGATATGDLTISNVIFFDSGATALQYAIIARNFPNLNIDNVLIRDMGTGFATLTDAANGSIRNLRKRSVTNGFSANSLGMIAPTIAGQQGWFVENLNPVEAGAAASKYVNEGWVYSGAWLPQHRLTGN